MSFCPNWIQQWSSVGTKAELWAGNKCRYKKIAPLVHLKQNSNEIWAQRQTHHWQVQVCLPEALPCSSAGQQTRMQAMRSSRAIVCVVTDWGSLPPYKAAQLLSHREEALLKNTSSSIGVEPGVLDSKSGGERRAVKPSDWMRGALQLVAPPSLWWFLIQFVNSQHQKPVSTFVKVICINYITEFNKTQTNTEAGHKRSTSNAQNTFSFYWDRQQREDSCPLCCLSQESGQSQPSTSNSRTAPGSS